MSEEKPDTKVKELDAWPSRTATLCYECLIDEENGSERPPMFSVSRGLCGRHLAWEHAQFDDNDRWEAMVATQDTEGEEL